MPTPQIQNDPVYSLPFLYKYGLILSRDATTPTTKLNVSSGQCRDSNDVIDITVGSPNIESETITAPLVLDATINGANGLDTGSLAASTMYSIYMIADSRYYQPTACIATLSTNSVPLLPFGYDSYRLIGYWATTSSSQWYNGWYSASQGSYLTFNYNDIPTAFTYTVTAPTVDTNISLSAIAPPIDNIVIGIEMFITSAVAGSRLFVNAYGAGVVTAIVLTSQVAAVSISGYAQLTARLNSGAPTIMISTEASANDIQGNLNSFSFSI